MKPVQYYEYQVSTEYHLFVSNLFVYGLNYFFVNITLPIEGLSVYKIARSSVYLLSLIPTIFRIVCIYHPFFQISTSVAIWTVWTVNISVKTQWAPTDVCAESAFSWTLMGKHATVRLVPAMMTSSNGNIFGITGPLCGEFTGHRGELPSHSPVTRSFDVFFDLRLNNRSSKQCVCSVLQCICNVVS